MRGFFTNPSRADDSFVPFSNVGSLSKYNEILALYDYVNLVSPVEQVFTAQEDMTVFVSGYVRSINYDQFINIETTGEVLNDEIAIYKYRYPSSNFTAETNLKAAFIKLKKDDTIKISMYNYNYGQCYCYIIKCNGIS